MLINSVLRKVSYMRSVGSLVAEAAGSVLYFKEPKSELTLEEYLY